MSNHKISDISNFLNDVIYDETHTRPFIEFGISDIANNEINYDKTQFNPHIIDTLNSLNRLLINDKLENQIMKEKLQKLFSKCQEHIRNRNRKMNQTEQEVLDKHLVQHIRSVDRLLLLHLQKNPHELLLKFGEEALVNNRLAQDSTTDGTCICGSKMIKIKKDRVYNSQFEVFVHICNRCGEKKFIMEKGVDFDVYPLSVSRPGEEITVRIMTNNRERIPIGYFVPIYIAEDIEQPMDVTYINSQSEAVIKLKLKDTISPQQYYATFFTVYNMQISLDREFFQVEEEINEDNKQFDFEKLCSRKIH